MTSDDSQLATISIVMPCRNHAQYLGDALQSLLRQDYPKLQIIVMDGGSTDGTREILENYSPSLHYWRSEPDDGQYAAINQGFEHASGDVLGWLNADDMLLPGSLWTLGSIFGQLPEVEWLTTMCPMLMDAAGSPIYCHAQHGYCQEAFLDGMHLPGQEMGFFGFIQQESTFWRRSLWDRAGHLDLSYRLAADFDLWSKFFRCQADLYATPAPLGCFRFTEGQRSLESYQEYLAEARVSLIRLRQDTGWGISYKQRLKEWILSTRIRGMALRCLFKSYRGLTVVRRHRGSLKRVWEISPIDYYHHPISGWLPNYPD